MELENTVAIITGSGNGLGMGIAKKMFCLLYTSDAADDLLCVDLGGRRIIKKKNKNNKYYFLISIHT